MKKKIWFCKKSFVVIEKCVSWKIQIQILFINDFEVIQDIIAKDIANNIKSLVNPKEIVTFVKVNTLSLLISKEIVRLSIQATANKISVEQKLRGKRGVTPQASQIKLKSTKLNLLKWYIQLQNQNLWIKVEFRNPKKLKQRQHNPATIPTLL